MVRDGVANGHGRQADDGRGATAWQATVGGGRRDGCDGVVNGPPSQKDTMVSDATYVAGIQGTLRTRDGNKLPGQKDKLLRTGQEKRNRQAICHRCCARQAHLVVS